MKPLNTRLPGLIVLEPTIHGDSRGWFQETYRQNVLADLGITDNFVQDNHSRSARGVLRGLHFQVGEAAQGKLVRCASGRVLDVAVDLRRHSPAYRRWLALELDGTSGRQLWVPAGFAHGFLVLSPEALVLYRTTHPWQPQAERCLRWNDPSLAIPWPAPPPERCDPQAPWPLLAPRDQAAPLLADLEAAGDGFA